MSHSARAPTIVIDTTEPLSVVFELNSYPEAAYLDLHRWNELGHSHYLIECVHWKRCRLRSQRSYINSGRDEGEYSDEVQRPFRGKLFPKDLSKAPGPWHTPLGVSFINLQDLMLDRRDAAIWAIPILNAIDLDAPFRHLLIRDLVGLIWPHSLPFPYQALDKRLMSFHAAKLVVALPWDEQSIIGKYLCKLPLLSGAGRIRVLTVVVKGTSTWPLFPQ